MEAGVSEPQRPTDPEPGGSWRRLLSDEEGTAAVEFAVLLPVYILLLAGLFSAANMALVRQAVVSAVRFEAWSGRDYDDPSIQRGLFGPYAGSYAGTGGNLSDVVFRDQDLAPVGGERGLLGGNPKDMAAARRIAAAALNNGARMDGQGGQAPLVRSRATGGFTYTGVLVGQLSVRPHTVSEVVLMRRHTRAEHVSGQQRHPVTALARPAHGFDPAAANDRYWSPLEASFGFNEGGGDPGIWSTRARIRGSAFMEHEYYKSQSKP